jgi:alkylhydroperoxidase/carboxymuconolactone decarboxylase family protein YurZ
MAKKTSRPPAAHQAFVARYPLLGRAWELTADAGRTGPLDERAVRLLKLAIAAGAMREGAVHASVRKAMDAGVTAAEIEQVVALTAGTLGFSSTVAVSCWVQDILGPGTRKKRR